MSSVYDLIVIGSGPAGQRAAIYASKLGKKVALVEMREVVGGACISTGTIPSKTMRVGSIFFAGRRAPRSVACSAAGFAGSFSGVVCAGWSGAGLVEGAGSGVVAGSPGISGAPGVDCLRKSSVN